MINSNKLKGRMRELGVTQKVMAEILNKSEPAVCQKINNVRPTTIDEAKTIASVLKIDDSELKEYFFK